MKKLLSILLTLVSLSVFAQTTITPKEIVLYPKDSASVIANKANTYNGGRAVFFYDAVTGQVKVGYGNALHALATKSFVWDLLGGGIITNVSGTSNRITVSGTSTKTVDISSAYAGQNTIVTTGTLTTGATGSGYTLDFGASTLSGRIAYANFPQGTALTVLGVAGNATANFAPIGAGSDGVVLRRSGTTLGFGAVDLTSANATSGSLPYTKGGTGIGTIGATGDMLKVNVAGTAYQSFDPSINLGISTTGSDVSWGTGSVDPGGSMTLNIPTASGANRGALSSTDWTTFNNKISSVALTLGTSGTDANVSGSGTASLTLNLPDASGTNRGLITTGAQTLVGAKTFSSTLLVGSTTNGISLSPSTGAITYYTSGFAGVLGFRPSADLFYTQAAMQLPSLSLSTSGSSADTFAPIFGKNANGGAQLTTRSQSNADYTGLLLQANGSSNYGSFNYHAQQITNSASPMVLSSGNAVSRMLYITPTYNISGGAHTVYGIDYNPTETGMVGTTHYGLLIRGATARSGFGVATPTAAVHLRAGTAAANTAPLKLTSGTNLTTPENGAVEFDGTHFYATIGSTRYQLDQQGGGGAVADAITDGVTTVAPSQNAVFDALADKANEALTQNSQTGSNYTLVLTDKDSKYIYMNSASAQTLTIPPNSSVAFPVGTQIPAFQIGAGALTFVAGSGAVNLFSTSGLMTTQQYAPVTLLKVATDTWIVCNGSPGTIITNTAATNEIPKSNGANLVPSGLFTTTAGDANFGTGLAGSSRTVTFDGSATNVGGIITGKGTGSVTLTGNGKSMYVGASSTNAIVSGGNVAIGTLAQNFNGLPHGIFITNGNTTPSAAPTAGVYVYSKAYGGTAELVAMNDAGAETRLTGNSGTYTPTLTNVTNVAASTAYNTKWYRVGDMITVFGKVSIDVATAASTQTEIGISLPVTSAMTAEEDLGGTAASDVISGASARIRADATNDRAAIVFKALSTTNDNYAFQFSYQVK